jgi:transposase
MNTPDAKLLQVEAVADLPVLWNVLQRLNLVTTLDRLYPAPIRWQAGITPGELLAVWLLHLLSRGDHRLNRLQPWVADHQGTLSTLLGKPIHPLDAQDDRLADWLTRLHSPTTWNEFECQLNQQTIRVYSIPTTTFHLDTTTANSYTDLVSEQGILQFGHSKDDPTRPQLKIATAVLDPLGMPMSTCVVPGNTADDPLYLPLIQELQRTVGVGGKLYVGDSKMGAFTTRRLIAKTDDFYLCPLSEVQLSVAQRAQRLAAHRTSNTPLLPVHRTGKTPAEPELVAEGFSWDEPLSAEEAGQTVTWTERRWMVRSRAYAASETTRLERRLTQTIAVLQALGTPKRGKKPLQRAELLAAAQDLLDREELQGLLEYTVHTVVQEHPKRAYGSRPAGVERTETHTVVVTRQSAAITEKMTTLGWQVYATNQRELSVAQVVWTYRSPQQIEDGWARMKGASLGLTPLYLQDEERIVGLVHFLSIALRVLTLLQWVIREQLRTTQQKLRDVYAGQPGRVTATPSAELLLEVMKNIQIIVMEIGGQVQVFLSPLTRIQRQLLQLWGLPADIYEQLIATFPKPPPNMSER